MEGISSGKLKTPLKGLFYGIPGVGKSTLAASFPKPIVLDTEGSTGRLDVDRVDLRKEKFSTVMDWLRRLAKEEHDYQTLVIDTIDWLEPKVWEATCARLEVPSIETPGYGRGYVETSSQEWPQFLAGCTYLCDRRGMNVVLLAHCEQKRIFDPMLTEYDRWDVKLHKRAAAKCVEWAECVGFLILETMVRRQGQKELLSTDGERVLLINEGAHYVAKNRFGYNGDGIKPVNYEMLAKELAL